MACTEGLVLTQSGSETSWMLVFEYAMYGMCSMSQPYHQPKKAAIARLAYQLEIARFSFLYCYLTGVIKNNITHSPRHSEEAERGVSQQSRLARSFPDAESLISVRVL